MKTRWHEGAVGGFIGWTIVRLLEVVICFGGGVSIASALLAVLAPKTFRQVFGAR